MSTSITSHAVPAALVHPRAKWYALHIRARHEKRVTTQLQERGILAFTPTVRSLQQWSDRRQVVDLPLFSSYVFVRVEHWRDVYLPVLSLPSVLQWVRLTGGEPSILPDTEIDALRTVVASRLSLSKHPYPCVGQKVRVRSGCLDGVEGVLVEQKGHATLVLSVHLLKQSIALSVAGYQVEVA